MSSIKERIFGAVTVMSEEDAQKVWDLHRETNPPPNPMQTACQSRIGQYLEIYLSIDICIRKKFLAKCPMSFR